MNQCTEEIHIGRPDGIPVDPCIMQVMERYENVTIEVMQCKRCGKVEISWFRQDNTVKTQ